MIRIPGNQWTLGVVSVAVAITCLLLWLMSGCSTSQPVADNANTVTIRRTTDGIPHIKASHWYGAGYGFGYVQAEDALCTLADAFVTYRGRRSLYWGADARPDYHATFGGASNLELDIFFSGIIDETVIKQYREQQSPRMQQLVDGFAAGYNHYLNQTRALREQRQCSNTPWLQPISADDVYRRLYAAGIAGGYARFIPQIVNARPPSGDQQKTGGRQQGASQQVAKKIHAQFANLIGDLPHLGSNALAFGRRATGEEQGVLFGNPHWYWGGPDRFYQAHLTIPGKLNVAGVSFLGVPVIVIGFNDRVAWSHTVSTARRYGLFELSLLEQQPTVYRFDQETLPMVRQTVTVPVREAKGEIVTVSRTLYRSKQGPLVDFGAAIASLGWSKDSALAIRDINADNFRIFETYLRWAQSQSLNELVAIQRQTAAIPWVNTVAIGRDDGRVWYADIGAVPNVSDQLRQQCSGQQVQAFSRLDPIAPLLDGSRSACNWSVSAGSAQPGAMTADHMPALFSEHYVANMNDSYWLTQPATPIEGLDRILGGEREPLSLRGQSGHQLAANLLQQELLSADQLSHALRHAVLDSQAYPAVRFKDGLLDAVCRQKIVTVTNDLLTDQALSPHKTVNIESACRVLADWHAGGNAEDRGSLLWDAWWRRLRKIPPAEFYRQSFSADQPLQTPAAPDSRDPRVAEALGAAIITLQEQAISLDARRGEVLSVDTGEQRIELFGGCSGDGYFTVACARDYAMDNTSFGNSYLQVVSFNGDGVDAYTLMAHGQDERALNGGPGGEAVRRYANKQWLRLPFSEQAIKNSPSLRLTTLLLDESVR